MFYIIRTNTSVIANKDNWTFLFCIKLNKVKETERKENKKRKNTKREKKEKGKEKKKHEEYTYGDHGYSTFEYVFYIIDYFQFGDSRVHQEGMHYYFSIMRLIVLQNWEMKHTPCICKLVISALTVMWLCNSIHNGTPILCWPWVYFYLYNSERNNSMCQQGSKLLLTQFYE